MLGKIRTAVAAAVFFCLCLLFLDFTGTIHAYLGWMAKIQLVPAALALNVGVIAGLAVLTLLFGRVYCSVICPLGIMQDIASRIHGRTAKKNKFRFRYRKALNWLRYTVLGVFVLVMALGGVSIAALIEPYSTFGRIVSNLFAPVYAAGNNLLAWIAERAGSYAFYSTDVWIKSIPTFVAAAVMFVLLMVMAWKDGRLWCNTICPVGSLLGLLSRFSLFAPTIDTDRCVNCGLCSRGCRSSCIDDKNHRIDYSRCVMCMDCIDSCREGAVQIRFRYGKKAGKQSACNAATGNEDTAENNGTTTLSESTTAMRSAENNAERRVVKQPAENKAERRVVKQSAENNADQGRRSFISGIAMAAGTAALAGLNGKVASAQEMKVDGGLAELLPKQSPRRETALVPFGAKSLKNFTDKCIACQLCVSVCPNGVLRPSTALDRLMQPEMSFEKGYCRPECTKCSGVCPTGAISGITREEKSSIKIGTAAVDYTLCLPANGTDSCGNCARHCPSHAIHLVPNKDAAMRFKVPAVDEEQCIGCGACEYLCPSRPISAIKVNGIGVHRERA